MTRTEGDLREALRELARRADRQGAPSSASILEAVAIQGGDHPGHTVSRHVRMWLPPLAAAAVVAAAALAAVLVGQSSPGSRNTAPEAGSDNGPLPSSSASATQRVSATTSAAPSSTTAATFAATAATVLDDAATKLDAVRGWTTPQPSEFFYVHTTVATTWSSVSGEQAGDGVSATGTKIWVSGCKDGQLVSTGESGPCTPNDVPHYLSDAPTTPAAWDAYLERLAPGAKAAGAQGKIIVEVLHQDLIAPRAAAALLRYTASCPGLHTLPVRPVNGENLIGVTCTSMTAGSYGIAFDASTHAFAGFVPVSPNGVQVDAAEVVIQTGIVKAIDRTP